ncbi:MAG: ATPase, T2SS/T4P/T4SS family, partial [Candidatus Omnitrophota bacterium]
MAQKSFIDYIVDEKILSREQTDNLLKICRDRKTSLVETIIKENQATEKQILAALSGYLSMPPIRVTQMDIAKEILLLVPEKTARARNIIPIGKIGNTLTVAMADPLNVIMIDDLKNMTGLEINPVIAGLSEIQSAISNSYSFKSVTSLEEIMSEKKSDSLELLTETKENISQEQIIKSLDDAPVIKFTQFLLERAITERTSDVFIEPLTKKGRIRFRIDGILQEVDSYPKTIHPFIVSRIKVLSKLNITEHRMPQDGRFRLLYNSRQVDFRVSVMPSCMGEKVVLRVLDQSAGMLDLDTLGFSEKVVTELKEDSLKPHG